MDNLNDNLNEDFNVDFTENLNETKKQASGCLRRFSKSIKVVVIGKSSVSCPLKPSDSAPLKHSTMPP